MRTLIICLIFSMFLLVGCGSDSGTDSGNGIPGELNGTFVDSSVTAFDYTTGSIAMRSIKKGSKGLLNFALSPAYAAVDETFSCYVGESIEFNLTALTNNVDVTTVCATQATVELAIRIGLLESLDGTTLKRTITDAAYKNGTIDLTGGFTWGATYYVVDIYKANDLGHDFADISNPDDTARPCYIAYTFNKATGMVVANSSRLVSESQNGGAGTADFCYDGDQTNVPFRFINGYMEFDLSGDGGFDPARGIHAVTELPCYNSGVDPQCESTYEKWEVQ